MDHLLYIVLTIIAFLGLISTETEIIATAPVNPVEEGSILSIHCEVRNLEENYKVVLYTRVNGKTISLSYGEIVTDEVDERVFLAVRQQLDGSTVYFMSIMDVRREEGGEYFCTVMDVADLTRTRVPYSSISMDVTYFPSDVDPVCSPKEPPIVNIGDIVTLNCSSAKASPTVEIGWTRTSDNAPLSSTQNDGGNRVYSEYRFKVKASDHKAVYLCGITSQSYPSRKQTCHVGPIVVSGVTDDVIESPPPKHTEQDILIPSQPDRPHQPKHNDPIINPTSDCNDICVSSETSLLFWVIATCVAGILAFVFLIVGVFLFIKFNRLPEDLNATYISASHPQHIEKVYDELETRRLEHQTMYMSLDKARKAELQAVYPTCES